MSSERQEYSEVSPWWGEHVFRYNEVIRHMKGSEKILDIACGNGYGTFILSGAVREKVIGGDIEVKTVEQCRQTFTRQNLVYEVLDATKLPFGDETFDIVVSFETIEHTVQFEKMISELKRVLKSGGTFFVSTPNRLITSHDGVIKNPFHTQEWSLAELDPILGNYFTRRELFGQHFDRYDAGKSAAKLVESILYKRGIRKIPLALQNAIMRLFGVKQLYPLPEEFVLVAETSLINQCNTLFGICKK
jgi:ubiquinone/menaquinone biosynthesis C-methylase UbiE